MSPRVAAARRVVRARFEYLDALFADPDRNPTQSEADEYDGLLRRSLPQTAEVVVAADEAWPLEADEVLAKWDRWYADPFADVLLGRVRIHVPPARLESRPRGRRPRGARRARSPARLADESEPPLAVVPLERFRADVDRWLGGAA